MSARYGALESEWVHFDLVLGLGSDLLPVVADPHAEISPSSALKQAGKVPSKYNQHRQVVGIPQWTSHRSTEHELACWSKEPDYGLCLQTRSVRAIDLDLTDAAFAQQVIQAITRTIACPLPVRTRPNSSKCLLVCAVPGPLRKRVIPTAHGLIEILADGNHFVACGTHPSGSRYEWAQGLPAEIPPLSLEQFERLWTTLCEFAISDPTVAHTRPLTRSAQTAPIDDPVVAYLHARGLSTGVSPSGRLYLTCPWRNHHSTQGDMTETAYFPAGTDGYDRGHFDCRHAGCAQRTDTEFLDAIGYLDHLQLDGFEPLVADYDTVFYPEDAPPSQPKISPLAEPAFDRDTKSGVIKPLLQNVVLALDLPDFCGHRISRDDFRDVLMLDGRPFKDADYTQLTLNLVKPKRRFISIPTELLKQAVTYVAERHAFDSAIDWLTGLPAWDGVSRVSSFCSRYLGVEASAYSRAVSRYWWTAHAGRVLTPGVQADIAIVMISTQGTGKTSSIKAMVPHPDEYVELSLLDRDEDLSRAMRGKLIGEMAELRGLNSRDLESIKAWISRQREEWVPKYLEFTRTFPRRLVLVGTSNQEEFLADETGNRRFAPILVGERQDRDGIVRDRDQLWAEAAALYRGEAEPGVSGVLWQDVEGLAKVEHSRFEIHDAWLEMVRDWLQEPGLQVKAPADCEFITMDDVLKLAIGIDMKYVKPFEQLRAGKILHQLGYRRANKRFGSTVKKVWVPGCSLV